MHPSAAYLVCKDEDDYLPAGEIRCIFTRCICRVHRMHLKCAIGCIWSVQDGWQPEVS